MKRNTAVIVASKQKEQNLAQVHIVLLGLVSPQDPAIPNSTNHLKNLEPHRSPDETGTTLGFMQEGFAALSSYNENKYTCFQFTVKTPCKGCFSPERDFVFARLPD